MYNYNSSRDIRNINFDWEDHMTVTTTDFLRDISKARTLYRIDEETCRLIKSFSKDAFDLTNQFLDELKEWLMSEKVFQPLFANENSMHEFEENQKKYWKEFFEANIDTNYLQSRIKMGHYYAHISLPLFAYCAMISYRLSWWIKAVNNSKKTEPDKIQISEAIKRLILLDTAATCIAYSEEAARLIETQSKTLLQLSTPTIQLWEGILLLPIVGVLDSIRAQNMMDELLNRIVNTSSLVSIIDIVAVPNVDSSVANHLIKIVRASKLLGNTCILSGISPEVAQSIVEVGINLDEVKTTSNLRNAFKVGLELVGLSIITEKVS